MSSVSETGEVTTLTREFPAIKSEHLSDARLFADRADLVAALIGQAQPTVAEVGVAFGDFSEILLDRLQPRLFVAIDLFRLDREFEVCGRQTENIFRGLSHRSYFENRFASKGDRVAVREGLSWEILDTYPDQYFDLIYIDAAHDFESVNRDATAATRKLRDDGLLVFNDYIMFDHLHGDSYGVIPNVNELVVNKGWRVVGFALQREMFCDIALRKGRSQRSA